MRYFFTVFLLVFICNISPAKTSVSELIAAIDNAPNDSLRVEAYKDVYFYFQLIQPDSAERFVNEGISRFKKSGYTRGVGVMHFLLAGLESMRGHLELARDHYQKSLELYEKISNAVGIAQATSGLGVVEARGGNHLAATRFFMRALSEFERIRDTNGILNTYLKLGNVSQLSDNLPQALEYFKKGLNLAEQTRDTKNLAYLYNGIGIVYGRMDQSDTAIAYLQKGLDLTSDAPSMLENKSMLLMNIGNAYRDKGQYKKSLEYYERSLEAVGEHVPETRARLLLNVASLKAAVNHENVVPDLLEAKKIAEEIGNKMLHMEVMEEMILQYKNAGDFKAAFLTLEELRGVRDSLFNVEKQTEIENLMSLHELEKSKEKVQKLEEKGKRSAMQRNIIIAISVVLALFLATISVATVRTRRLNAKLRKSEAELQKTSAIKDRIFSIIGHDLRGPIANIPMVIELYQDPSTSEAEKAYMRDLLVENSMASLDTLDKLLHWGKAQIKGSSMQQKSFKAFPNLQHQVSLIKGMASNKGINIKVNVPADASLFADEDHFNFVIRNLLSNAIKFSHPNSEITVDADRYTDRGFTIFSVADQGVGIDKERMAKIFEAFGSSTLGTNNEGGTSIGLMLCKEFVLENGGRIWVESEPGKGTTFFFTLKNA